MSLIHQALKKLDSSAGVAPKQGTGTTAVKSENRRKKVLFAVMVVAILLFGAVYLLKYIPETGTGPAQNLKTGSFETAVKAAGPGVEVKKERSKATVEAIFLYRAGKYKEAIKLFKAELKARPDDPVLHNNLGLVYFEDSQVELARKHFTRALSLKHDYAEAINNYGAVLASIGKSKEAIALYNKAIEIKPEFQPAYFNMAVEYEKNAKFTKARRLYEEYLKFETVKERNAVKKRIKELRATE